MVVVKKRGVDRRSKTFRAVYIGEFLILYTLSFSDFFYSLIYSFVCFLNAFKLDTFHHTCRQQDKKKKKREKNCKKGRH